MWSCICFPLWLPPFCMGIRKTGCRLLLWNLLTCSEDCEILHVITQTESFLQKPQHAVQCWDCENLCYADIFMSINSINNFINNSSLPSNPFQYRLHQPFNKDHWMKRCKENGQMKQTPTLVLSVFQSAVIRQRGLDDVSSGIHLIQSVLLGLMLPLVTGRALMSSLGSLCLCKESSVASSWRQSGYWGLSYLGLHENPLCRLHTAFTWRVLQSIREGMICSKQMRPLSRKPEGNEVLVKWMRVSGELAILSELVGVSSTVKGTRRERC